MWKFLEPRRFISPPNKKKCRHQQMVNYKTQIENFVNDDHVTGKCPPDFFSHHETKLQFFPNCFLPLKRKKKKNWQKIEEMNKADIELLLIIKLHWQLFYLFELRGLITIGPTKDVGVQWWIERLWDTSVKVTQLTMEMRLIANWGGG